MITRFSTWAFRSRTALLASVVVAPLAIILFTAAPAMAQPVESAPMSLAVLSPAAPTARGDERAATPQTGSMSEPRSILLITGIAIMLGSVVAVVITGGRRGKPVA